MVFVDHNKVETNYEDFYLMSLYKYYDIVNNPFTWWLAWLNGNANKQV